MKQDYNVNTPMLTSFDDDLSDGTPINAAAITVDIPLMRQVVNDMEYNVGSRPTLPSCIEDSSELGVVDVDADIRVSHWDKMAYECSYSRVSKTDEKSDESNVNVEPAPSE